ncbi:MAG: nucleotidyltransferase domain-containing protein [Polynucleobacter sp.]
MEKRIIDDLTKVATSAFMVKLARQYQFSSALLFGSRARGSHHLESDADVAILLKGKAARFMATKFAMDDIAYEVLLDTGIRIQPLPIWQDEWDHPENYSNPSLLRNVQSEGIAL